MGRQSDTLLEGLREKERQKTGESSKGLREREQSETCSQTNRHAKVVTYPTNRRTSTDTYAHMHACISIYALTHTHTLIRTHAYAFQHLHLQHAQSFATCKQLDYALCLLSQAENEGKSEKGTGGQRERGSGIKLLCHGAAEIHFTCHSVWKKRNIWAALRRANNFPLINIKSIFDLNNGQASREFMLLLLPHVACHIKCCKAIQFMRQFPLCVCVCV